MSKGNDAAKLEIAPELTPEMGTIIGNGLSEYNRLKAGYVDGRDLPVILTHSKTVKSSGASWAGLRLGCSSSILSTCQTRFAVRGLGHACSRWPRRKR